MSDALALTEAHTRALEFCTYCPRLCHFACPTAHGDASETATAWGMMTLANMIRRGELTPGPEDARNLYRCTSCSRCTAFCRHENPVADVLQTMRGHMSVLGLEPAEFDAMRKSYASAGAPHAVSDEAIALAQAPKRRAGFAYFPSCTLAAGGAARPEAARRLVELVAGSNVDIAWTPESFCCGGVAARAGLETVAERARVRLRAAVAGYHTIVTDCGGLDLGEGGPRVVQLAEFLATRADVLAELASSKGEAGPVALHGGCRQRRPDDLGADERALLEALGIEVVDAFAISDEQECCGGDGVYSTVSPDGAARAARALVAGARTDERPLISSSCRCAAHLSASSGEEVLSLLDVLIERCSIPD